MSEQDQAAVQLTGVDRPPARRRRRAPLGVRDLLGGAALAALLLASCGSAETGDHYEGANRCDSDLACIRHGGACDLDLGACVDPALLGGSLILRLVDPVLGTTSECELVASELNAAAPTVVRLASPVVVRGMVADERGGTLPIPAHLTFRRRPLHPGLSPESTHVESTPLASEDGLRSESFNFQVSLLPGTYDVEVEATGEMSGQGHEQIYHPIYSELEVAGARTHLDLRFTERTRRVFGVVTDAAGEPMPGVRVFARDGSRGRRISNVALTGCPADAPAQCGRFELAVPEDTTTFRLRIQGSESAPLLPSVDRGSYDFDQLDMDADGALSGEELPEVRFPSLPPPVLLRASVVGQGAGGVWSPVVGATIVFRSDQIGDPASPVGSFEARAQTEGDGVVSGEGRLGSTDGPGIWLRPAPYSVSVTPPPESAFSAAELSFELEAPDDADSPVAATFQVGPRQAVGGLVTAPGGTVLPRVRVEARSTAGQPFATTTDDLGRFLLAVDPGRYDLLFATDARSNLPWTSRLGVPVFGDLEVGLEVGFGTPVRGSVVRQTDGVDMAAPGMTVEAYTVLGAEDGDRLVAVGRTVVDDSGSFVLLVTPVEPSQPPVR